MNLQLILQWKYLHYQKRSVPRTIQALRRVNAPHYNSDLLLILGVLNKRNLQTLILQVSTNAVLYSLILLMLTTYLGFYALMNQIGQHLDRARVISISGLDANLILDDPGNQSWSPDRMIITASGYQIITSTFHLVTVVVVMLASLFFVFQITSGIRMVRAEIKSQGDHITSLRMSLVTRKTVIMAYLLDHLSKSLLATGLGILFAWEVMFPALNHALAHNIYRPFIVLNENPAPALASMTPTGWTLLSSWLLLRRALSVDL